jgi:hypothetical protein
MRTTLTLDPDVLAAARALAEMRGQSIGQVISDLARRGLAVATATPTDPTSVDAGDRERNGVPLFPVRAGAGVVTPDIVRQLLDDETR